jgi:hypothetical protein
MQRVLASPDHELLPSLPKFEGVKELDEDGVFLDALRGVVGQLMKFGSGLVALVMDTTGEEIQGKEKEGKDSLLAACAVSSVPFLC